MLFFFSFHQLSNSDRSSFNRLLPSLLCFLFICYTCLTVSNASSYYQREKWTLSNENLLNNYDNEQLERTERGTGFFVYRKGEYIFLIPDRRHHFTKTFRPYIGRRR